MAYRVFCFIAVMLWAMLNPLSAAPLTEIKQDFSDALITTKITAQFAEHSELNPLKISASTDKGIVRLSGYVNNKKAYIDALRIVKNTPGVKSIRTQDLHIKQVNSAVTDTFITTRVEAAVLKAKVLDDESIPLVGINASTTNGIVTLSGTVHNSQSILFIIKRVNAIRGVKKIITHLTVKDNS